MGRAYRFFGSQGSMKKVVNEILGRRVRERLAFLKANGRPFVSQVWLGKQVGLTQQHISDICKGYVRRPPLLREIALVLETTQAYLLGETDDPKPALSLDEALARLSRLSPEDAAISTDAARALAKGTRAAKRRPSGRAKVSPKPS